VDATLRGELAGNATIEIRTLRAKASNRREPDFWSEWQSLSRTPGRFEVALGRERFNGKDVSLHGVYRFQLRVKVAGGGTASGLSALQLTAHFENGVMSIPQIFEGLNTVRFKVNDGSKLNGPIEVIYRYETAAGERSHRQVLQPSDFRGNEAAYVVDAPGLIRCNSLAVVY
jgi:hypothetical protein